MLRRRILQYIFLPSKYGSAAITLPLNQLHQSSSMTPDEISKLLTPRTPYSESPRSEAQVANKKRRAIDTDEIDILETENKRSWYSSLLQNIATPNFTTTPRPNYLNGALRITRTPGRSKHKNCVNLHDIIDAKHLVSACIYAFFIGGDELYQHLPFSHDSDKVPIYVGRDANMDPMLEEACQQIGIPFREKVSNKDLQRLTPALRSLYAILHGQNYHAFYAWSSGSSHSKVMALVYPTFLRIVITSCNLMDTDTVLGDNHWYIHDLPKVQKLTSISTMTPFEEGFLAHLAALSTPEAFINSIRGMYDYSTVKVHLVTSMPGVMSGSKAENHGLLRLRHVIQDLDLPSTDLKLELCAASIGNLSPKWLSMFRSCASGSPTLNTTDVDATFPDIKIFYPTVDNVKNAHTDSQEGAANIGCHTRPWEHANPAIKKLFHHYESKDTGRLFHQKLILAIPSTPSAKGLPAYVYVGSANLSQSAWGALEKDKKGNEKTDGTKLVKTSNFECGVVISGDVLEGLLEDGTEGWETGIVTFNRKAAKYSGKKKPWNDPRWV